MMADIWIRSGEYFRAVKDEKRHETVEKVAQLAQDFFL